MEGVMAVAGAAGETVCVTGAGGYIASWLVKLLLARGYTVRDLDRPDSEIRVAYNSAEKLRRRDPSGSEGVAPANLRLRGMLRRSSWFKMRRFWALALYRLQFCIFSPQDEKKTGHLRSLENASENLKLFKADLLDYDDMAAAIAGCRGVFHVASLVPSASLTDPELEVVRPAVTGTRNVLEAASPAKIRRAVVVSSIVAVDINPKDWPTDKIKDENSWLDVEFCRHNEDWYSVSKITAEKAAHEYGRQTGLNVVTPNPAVVLGPLLQPTVNASSQFLIYFLKGVLVAAGGPDRMRDKLWHIVDVRDTANALLLLYEAPEASGRHICAPHIITTRNLRGLLKSIP